MMPRDDKNTSVFVDGDLSRAEAQRRGEGIGRKERIDRKGWKRVRLGDVCICLDNCRKPINEVERIGMKGSISYCGANGIVDYVNDFTIDDSIILIAEDGGYFDEYETRPIAYRINGKAWVNNHAHIIKAKSICNQDFIFYALEHKNIVPFITSGTRAKLTKRELLNIELLLPSKIEEQQRIAIYLSSIDTGISTTQKLIAKYEAIKKATVNLLLKPKAGWRRVKIEDIFEIKVGGDLDTVHYSEVKTSFCRYEVVSNSLSNRGLYGYTSLPKFPADSITITGRGNVGHAEYRGDQFDAIVRIVVLSPIDANVCTKFVAELINTISPFQIESTGVPQLTAPQIATVIISLPPIDEQKRIVKIIESLDVTISGLRAQLVKSQSIKQGMMTYFFG